MPLPEPQLESLPYRDLVELAKAKGVYNKRSSKKMALIKRLSSLWSKDEISMIENIDPNRSSHLTPVEELDETVLSEDDAEVTTRRKTFTRMNPKKQKLSFETPLVNEENRRGTFTKSVRTSSKKSPVERNDIESPPRPPVRENTFTKDDKSGEVIDTGKKEEQAKSERRFEMTPQKISASKKHLRLTPINSPDITQKRSKGVKRSWKESECQPELNTSNVLIRQNTSTKEDSSTNEQREKSVARVSNNASPVNPKKLKMSFETPLKNEEENRRETFTKSVTMSSTKLNAKSVDIKSSPRLVRQNTFTKDDKTEEVETNKLVQSENDPCSEIPIQSASLESSSCQSNAPKTPARQNTFTKDDSPVDKKAEMGSTQKMVDTLGKCSTPVRVPRFSKACTPQSEVKSTNRFSTRNSSIKVVKGVRKSEGHSALSTTINGTPSVVRPSSAKKSSVKKIPNFAEIHKKQFAKLESLLENKLRWKDRARQLMSSPGRISKMTKLKKDSKSDGRTSCIPILAKKLATKERLQKAVASKSLTGVTIAKTPKDKKMLNGVRMNKRFELQLKSVEAKKYTT